MDYTVHELMHNQSFRRMVKGEADADEINRWNHWIEADDEHRQTAKEAIAEITGFEFRGPEAPDMTAEWDRLGKATIHKNHTTSSKSHNRRNDFRWLYRVAAILLLAGLMGAGIFMYAKNHHLISPAKQIAQGKTVSTASNEQQTIAFADGSKITLNSHSTISYQSGALHHQSRKVQLRGEAYFSSSKGAREFTVHTSNGTIRDIGTKFMVKVEKDHSEVVVQKGSVEIRTKEHKSDAQKITMKKGEMLSFDRTHVLSKKMVNPTFYTSWATGYMQFNQTSLQKFAGYVEKRFNVNVQITKPKLAHIKLDGSIYFKSLTDLIQSVSKVMMIPAHQSKDGKTVYLGKMNR
jgi:ferric-dicitrate binding protein FerR (iron transport regulator)